MPSNQEISRQFRLYAELLLLHGEDERLADYLAGAAYRLTRLEEGLSSKTLPTLFHPSIVAFIREFETTGTIATLEELIQLTPAGLFDMMRIKGLGGKKLHKLWRVAKIDSVEKLLAAAHAGKIHDIPGFGVKTEQNIIAAISSINDQTAHFYYADVADIADGLVKALRVLWETSEVGLCGDIRRQSTTVERIDIVTSDKALLKAFDLVIVSVHQQLKMTEQKATARLIKAIENPLTTILGHMTGRQLLVRPGYPLDFRKIIDACAANGVVIEVNANPYRLDMDWTHLPYALKKGVMISIDPDAHSVQEIDNIRWGVSAARKGGLTREMTWNAQSLRWVEQWLRRR